MTLFTLAQPHPSQPVWFNLYCQRPDGLPVYSTTGAEWNGKERRERDGQVALWLGELEQATGAKFGENLFLLARCFGPLSPEPVGVLEYLGLTEGGLKNLPGPLAQEAWLRLLERFGDLSGKKPSRLTGTFEEKKNLLLLGRAKGFPVGPKRQVEELLGLLLAQAGEEGLLLLEPAPWVPAGEDWVYGQFRARAEETGLGAPVFWARPFLPFDSCNFVPQPFEAWPPTEALAFAPALEQTVATLEGQCLDLFTLTFVAGSGRFWPLGLGFPANPAPEARLEMLLDLNRQGRLDAPGLAMALHPQEVEGLMADRLEETDLLEPLGQGSALTGAPGAAVGKVYFSAKALLAAEPGPKLLFVAETFPQDFPALKVARGILTAQGGFSSHGPVMARSLGKPALLLPEAKLEATQVRIGGQMVQEGQWLSLEAPTQGPAKFFRGKARLVQGKSEVLERLAARLLTLPLPAKVLVNGDEPDRIAQAMAWGAQGAGLVRMENLLVQEPFFPLLLGLVLNGDQGRTEMLTQLSQTLSRALLARMEPVGTGVFCLRLLDLPSHELLPAPGDPSRKMAARLADHFPGTEAQDWFFSLQAFRETNPMLGYRGARLLLSHFFLVRLQVTAFLEAAELLHRKTPRLPRLQLMVPFVALGSEFEVLRRGRNEVEGIEAVVDRWTLERGFSKPPFELELGVMVELPSLALDGANLAREASFFSFGGNDLTQAALGLSREDWSRFSTAYTQLDLMSDPFVKLNPQVARLMGLSLEEGRSIRPDLGGRFCGEQLLGEEELLELLEMGLTQFSVSPARVPGLLLRLARLGQRSS